MHILLTKDLDRWVEHSRARAMVDAAGNPFAAAAEHDSNSSGYGPSSKPIFAQVLENNRITSEDHEQDVRYIKLDLGNSVQFITCLWIFPSLL